MKKSVSFFTVALFLSIAFCELSQVNPQKAIAKASHNHQVSITFTNPPSQNQTILMNQRWSADTTRTNSSAQFVLCLLAFVIGHSNILLL
jgi:hypothetical protein